MNCKYLNNCSIIDSGIDSVTFYRCTMNAGESVMPKLDAENIIVLLFNGFSAYIQTSEDIFNISEPAVFIPDFEHFSYTIHALESLEFILCVFPMNTWDKAFFKDWNLHLPFFSLYSDGVRYNYMGRSKNLGSWSLVQPFQLGHLSLSVIRGKGGSVKSQGNPLQNQWLYTVEDSQYYFSSGNEQEKESLETSGAFRFVPVGEPYSIHPNDDKLVCYFNIEYFVESNLQKNYLAQIFNGRMTETK